MNKETKKICEKPHTHKHMKDKLATQRKESNKEAKIQSNAISFVSQLIQCLFRLDKIASSST